MLNNEILFILYIMPDDEGGSGGHQRRDAVVHAEISAHGERYRAV